MHITWSYAGDRVAGFDELLGRYRGDEFASPRRSTVPLLAYWRTPEQRARELAEHLGFALSDSLALDFEHEVPPQRGEGEPSHTDLMWTSGSVLLAIEGKSTEPRYKDVTKWLGAKATDNKVEVLNGWLDLINTCAATNVEADDLMDLPYQLIHRAASACYPEAVSRWLLYQLFDASSEKRDMYLADLEALAALMGEGSRLRIYLADCSVQRSERQVELERLWDAGERDLSEGVLAGLRAGDLLRVELDRVIAM